MKLKNDLIAEIIEIEGGYVNHPADRGGPTKYGITEKVARAFGYQDDMRDLPKSKAFEIYDKNYWQRLGLDGINDPELCLYIFDFGVNSGTRTAGLMLQTIYNELSNAGIVEDGVIGPVTQAAINNYNNLENLKFAYYCRRGDRFLRIVASDPSQRVFIQGWLNRLRKISNIGSSPEPVVREFNIRDAVYLVADRLLDKLDK